MGKNSFSHEERSGCAGRTGYISIHGKDREFMKEHRKTYLFCCLLMMIHTGLNSVATAAMPSLRAYYHTDLTNIVLGASVCCVSAFIAIFFADHVIQKIGPRKTLMLGSICGLIFCLLMACSDQLVWFYMGCFFAGLLVGYGTHAPCNVYIRRMDAEKRGILTSGMVTAGLIGGASFQVLTGYLLKSRSVSFCYLIMAGLALIAFIVGTIGLKDVKAEPIKQKREKKEKQEPNFQRLLKNPSFLLMAVIVLMGPAYITIFSTLLTSILQNAGMDPANSSLYLSAYTLLGGITALFTGRIFDRFQVKIYVLLLYTAYFIGTAAMLCWNRTGFTILLCLAIASYAVSMPVATLYNLVSGPFFGDLALAANTKLMSIAYFGSTVVLPIFSELYQTKGLNFLWGIMAVLAIICMGFTLTVIRLNHLKENRQTP